MFIVSLAIADLIVGLSVMPISAIYIFTEDWLFGIVVCQFWIGVDYTASTASILNLFILSLDRYWSVMSPLKYLRKRTKKRAMIMISLVWTASSLWLIPIIGWHYFEHGGIRTVPSDVCDTEYANNIALKIISGILNYYLPLAFMFFLYSRIFMEIRKRSEFELGQRISGSGGYNTHTHKQVLHTSSMTDESNQSNNHENHEDDNDDDHEDTDTGSYAAYSHNKCIAPEQRTFLSHPQFRVTEYEIETGSEDELAKLHRGEYTNLTLVKAAADQLRETTGTSCSSDIQTSDAEVRMEYLYDETVVDPTTERIHRFYDEHTLPMLARNNEHRPITAETSLGSTTSPGSIVHDPLPNPKPKITVTNMCNANGTRRAFLTAKVHYKPKSKSGKHKKRRKGSTLPGIIQFRRMGKHNYDVETALKKQAMRWRERLVPNKPKKKPSAALAREIKAAKQLGVIMGAFTICFCPYFVLFMVVAFCDGCISMNVMITVTWIGYLNSTLNPVLYPLCNTTFRRKFRNMLGLDKNDPKKGNVTRTYIANSRLTVQRPAVIADVYDSKVTTY